MIPSFLLEKENFQFKGVPERKNFSFIDRTIKNAAAFVSDTLLHWQSAGKNGLFQSLNSRVKVVFLIIYVILISLTSSITCQLINAVILLSLYIFSRLNVFHIYKRVIAAGFIFGFLIFLPASLNIFTSGVPAFTIIRFSHPHSWWIYNIPQEITVTREGIMTVIRLTLKVINSISLVLLVISTTTFEQIVKSLSLLKIPDVFLLTLTLTYKFIYILSITIIEIYEAIKMRWWNRRSAKDAEELVAGRIGYLFRKSRERYGITYRSMTARGFNGTVNFYYPDNFKLIDYLFIAVFILIFVFLIIINYFNARII